MCLVEVEKTPKLQVGCTLPVAEGMVVHTDSPHGARGAQGHARISADQSSAGLPGVRQGRRVRTAGHGLPLRRGREPLHWSRSCTSDEKQWSPVVFFDAPRCILCYRCVRICDEGMGVKALGVGNRGAISEIVPNHYDHLECDECGACIDICPVGALTSGTYRYQTRPWEMEHVGTICTHCADGCKTTLGVRNDEIIRGNNRDRSRHQRRVPVHQGPLRVRFREQPGAPAIAHDSQQRTGCEPVSWSEALTAAAQQVQRSEGARRQVRVIGSNHTTNEENYFLQKFARQALGTNNIDHHRTGDLATLFDALSGKKEALATTADLYDRKAILVVVERSLAAASVPRVPDPRQLPASRRACLHRDTGPGPRAKHGGAQRRRPSGPRTGRRRIAARQAAEGSRSW